MLQLITYIFQKDGTATNILDILFPYGDIAVAELIDVQTDETGNNVTQMYQLIGAINDERVPGPASSLNYINDNLYSKADPAINEHSYYITNKYIIFNITMNISTIKNKVSQIMLRII